MEPLRVLELYSGIGGMHHALRESGIPAHVVAAVDVNTVANEVYKHNFPHTHLLAKTIENVNSRWPTQSELNGSLGDFVL
uniref:tRNA aspartic acid methyltransferase 1 n=1 Tax=Peromyscus maniculatus bairdii TaxID=230844 RepID=A0A8C8U6L1_PERMB